MFWSVLVVLSAVIRFMKSISWCVLILFVMVIWFCFMACIFFYCSGAHAYLHSFPTRRSADLMTDASSDARAKRYLDEIRQYLGVDRFTVNVHGVRSEEHTYELQ